MEQEAAQAADGMIIYLRDDAPLPPLTRVFEGHGKSGNGRVEIQLVDRGEGEIGLTLPKTYQINAAFRQAVKSIPGIVDVQDL